ncbi:MAG: hypothetical protein PHC43_06765 [Candidatus Marinimicrobia bacterium]|jgi:hypothetical protein|nr:hypothetical protein [Candidatus Neomarinimicrobiota bacterium]
MKKITLILLTFLSLVGFSSNKVISEKMFELKKQTGKRTEISQVSSYGYAILSEGDNFYLLDKNNGFEKTLICSKSEDTPQEIIGDRIRFSTNDRYLCIEKKESNRKTLEIYDTVGKNKKLIKSEVGNVVNASIFDIDNIIYQVRTRENEAKTYLIRNGGQPEFITEGIGERWSPDGKWFFIKGSRDNPDKNAKMKRIMVFSIFDSDGKKMIETSKFGTSNWIRWSPTSDKIVFSEFGSAGFYIIYFKEQDGKLSIDHYYHFRPEKDENNYYGTLQPEFSPDGTKVSFIRSIDDGHYIYNQNIWILEDGSYQYYQVSDFNNTQINDLTWINSNEILAIKEDVSARDKIEIHNLELRRQQ